MVVPRDVTHAWKFHRSQATSPGKDEEGHEWSWYILRYVGVQVGRVPTIVTRWSFKRHINGLMKSYEWVTGVIYPYLNLVVAQLVCFFISGFWPLGRGLHLSKNQPGGNSSPNGGEKDLGIPLNALDAGFWSNYSDLTRPISPNGGLVREIPLLVRET